MYFSRMPLDSSFMNVDVVCFSPFIEAVERHGMNDAMPIQCTLQRHYTSYYHRPFDNIFTACHEYSLRSDTGLGLRQYAEGSIKKRRGKFRERERYFASSLRESRP